MVILLTDKIETIVEMSIPELFSRCRLKAKRNQLFDYKTGIISYL